MEENIDLINNYKKRNRKLFVFYKILANDLLFYYTISFLFLSAVKGLSVSQIVFGESFYPIFKLLFQIPCTMLIQKIGKRNSLIIGNLSVAIYLGLVLILNSTFTLILANIFCAIGFVIKGIAEPNFIYDSLENNGQKKEGFSKIEGLASSIFFFLDAITSLITGFIYVINPYLPITLSLITISLSVLVNLFMHEIKESNQKNVEKTSFVKEFKNQLFDVGYGFKYIFKSPRLKALILFDSLFASLVILMVTLHRSILDSINISAEYLGIIFAIMGLVVSFSSTRSVHLHKAYKNKTLSILGIILTISIFLTGIIPIIFTTSKFWTCYLILIMISLVYIVKGPFYILIKQYLNSFCDSNMRIKIYSANLFFEYISTSTIGMICSILLEQFPNYIVTILIGSVGFILMLLLIKFMSTRVGLKPEQYSEKDIFFLELN